MDALVLEPLTAGEHHAASAVAPLAAAALRECFRVAKVVHEVQPDLPAVAAGDVVLQTLRNAET